MKAASITLALLSLLAAAPRATPAAPPPAFPFVIPWDDARPSPLDVSGLNDGPAGSHGFIVVKNGHFAESGTGKRVRFLGTNFVFAGCFPTHEAADSVAAHLAKYGVNAVRLHHQDNTYGDPNTTVWDPKYPDHRHLDPAKLERMDYLIAALKRRGIYVDMCLHVSRRFTPADGFPASVSQVDNLDKRVDEFDPRMIAVDQEYFRDLMTHVNPYTHLRYADDPAFLSVEINNENSLMSFNDAPGSDLGGLPEPYAGELRALWNGWLARKYGTTARLAQAWQSPDRTHGPNLYPWTPDAGQWTLEVQPGAQAALTREGDALRADVTQVDDTNWHVQLYRKGMGVVHNGKTYTLTFEARADRDRDQEVAANLQHPGYNNIGLSAGVHLTAQWQRFSATFTADGAEAGQNRLPSLTLGGQTGTVWLRNVAVRAGVGAFALPPGQTLAAKTVAADPTGRGVPRTDWLHFLADTEDAYNAQMRRFLRRVVGIKPLITLSQVSFGGLYGAYRESASDFVDAHSYWDYADWFNQPITDRPMTPALGSSDALSGGLGLWRVAGKPFTVSEYNIPFPNEFRAEAVPEYASFAAVQDWDALYLFSHSDYGAGGATDHMAFPLEAGADPAVFGFFPAAALMFRAGLVPPAPASATLALPARFPAARVAAGLDVGSAWGAGGMRAGDTFTRRVALGIGLPQTARAGDPRAASPLRVSAADPKTARYVADAPGAKAVTGFVGGRTVTFSGASVTFGTLTNDFGALTLTALDRKPLARSSRVLLTFVTRTRNTGQTWNAARTLLTAPGSGPILVDGAAATVSMSADGPRRVYALDTTGARGAEVPSAYKNGRLTFSVSPAQKTIWYAVVAP